MNNKELQSARCMFFLTVSEAAKHIGRVSPRTWQRWEKSDSNVPEDVAEKMHQLACERNDLIFLAKALADKKITSGILYEMTLADYQQAYPSATLLDWRLSQCVAAYFFIENDALTLN